MNITQDICYLITNNIYKPEYKLLDWNSLSLNSNAIHLLEDNKDKINWYYLSMNKNAYNILEDNKDKINWYYLSRNTNPKIIKFLEKHQEVINKEIFEIILIKK